MLFFVAVLTNAGLASGMHASGLESAYAEAHRSSASNMLSDTASLSDEEAYRAFRGNYSRPDEGPELHALRLAVFARSRKEVEAQNSKPGATWWAELNHLADTTDDEFKAMVGYKRSWKPSSLNAMLRGSSFLQTQPSTIAESRDWRSLRSSSFFRNQGGCGSCWAVAVAGALEMHAEKYQILSNMEELSFKQLVDCVPNPDKCGGDGGCKGATAELAFQYVQSHGIVPASAYKDGDSTAACPTELPSPAFKTHGFQRLATNELKPLLTALSNAGPVVVSADATPWGLYGGGVFDNCKPDATVNHAILMVGYGNDATGGDYWLIRNSWGATWGENGYIRIKRHSGDRSNDGKDGFCGTDSSPREGVGCVGGPATLPVCGMCGILSDSSYPVMTATDATALGISGA